MTDEIRSAGRLIGPITFALLIALGLLAIRSVAPPPVADAKPPLLEFSAARMMPDLREIAKKPHPLGSAEHDRVRKYLWQRLFDLSGGHPLPFDEKVTVASRAGSGPDTWAVLDNVGLYLRGTHSTGTVLMVAHYDSVPSGPGAGDNAASVVALLGTVAAITLTGRPLRNDVIILFTDGEELGMLGAKGFIEDHSLLHNLPVAPIKLVLNFDMRGDEGPSMMFQTSAHNSWLIEQLAAAAPFPYATSAAAAVYKRMPNDTDLTVFLDAGMAGMNFAAAGGITRYHTALDNADLLDQRTLQHQGTYTVSMARQFGSVDLNAPRSGEEVFFDVGHELIHYSTGLAIPLAALVTMLVLAVLLIAVRDARFSIGGIAAGLAIYTLAIAVATVEARGMWHLMATLAGWRMLPAGTTYGGFYYSVATVALIFATLWSAYALIGRRIGSQNLGAGALLVWAVMMLASSIATPAASYIFTWPIPFATLAIADRSTAAEGHFSIRAPILAILALAPGTAMLAPVFAASPDGTMLFLMLSGLTAALLFGLFVPYLDFLTGGHRWIAPAVLGVLALAMVIKGNAASGFDASHPHPDSIFYFLDADRGSARWVSLDSRPDAFSAQFFQHHVRGGWLPRLTGLATDDTPASSLAEISRYRGFAYLNGGRTTEGDAPLIDAAPPQLIVLDDSTIAGARTVKMHIATARQSSAVWISVPVGVTVLGSSIDGRSPGDQITDGWAGWYWQAPWYGFDLTLKLATPAPFVVTVIEQTDGLPQTPQFAIKPRPAATMPTPFLFFDSATLVRKTLAIGGEQVTRR